MSNFYKNLSKKELEYVFNGIKFPINPRWHQLVSLAFAADKRRILMAHGVGTGKTISVLLWNQIQKHKKVLVVCPPRAFGPWKLDIYKFKGLSVVFLTGTPEERLKLLKEKHNIYVCNYEGLKSIFCDFGLINSKSKRRAWKLNFSKLDIFRSFDCLVIDEVHRVNDYNSIQSNICFELSKRVHYVIGVTGTPIDRSMLELFNIMKVIDLGRSLGGNFFFYREKYFYKHGYEWELKTGAKEEILNRISDVVIYFDRKECFDLPKNDEIVWVVDPEDEFNIIQSSIIKNGSIEIQDGNVKIKLSSIKAKGEVLRQISCGFFYYTINNQRYAHRLKNNPKIEALIDKLKDLSCKVIVFFRYTEEGNIITEALNKNKIQHVLVRGGEPDNNKNIEKFQKDEKCKVLIGQISTCSECWDGTIAKVAIMMSPISSPRVREQCTGRINRSGQDMETLTYYFVMNGSIDFKVLSNKEKRQSFVKDVEDFLREHGGEI